MKEWKRSCSMDTAFLLGLWGLAKVSINFLRGIQLPWVEAFYWIYLPSFHFLSFLVIFPLSHLLSSIQCSSLFFNHLLSFSLSLYPFVVFSSFISISFPLSLSCLLFLTSAVDTVRQTGRCICIATQSLPSNSAVLSRRQWNSSSLLPLVSPFPLSFTPLFISRAAVNSLQSDNWELYGSHGEHRFPPLLYSLLTFNSTSSSFPPHLLFFASLSLSGLLFLIPSVITICSCCNAAA